MDPVSAGWQQRWLYALKPATWPKLLVPAGLGQAIGIAATGVVNPTGLVAGLAFTVALLAFSILVNDYGDQEVDALKRRLFPEQSSPKTIPDGILEAKSVLWGGVGAGAAAVGVAIVAQEFTSRPGLAWGAIVCVGIFVIYTFAPLKLNYRGGGELLQMLGVGFALPWWNAYAQSGLSMPAGLVLLPAFALLCLSSALAGGLADEQSDRLGGKRTFVTMFGGAAVRQAVEGLIVGAMLVWLVMPRLAPHYATFWMMLPAVITLALDYRELRRAAADPDIESYYGLARYRSRLHDCVWRGGGRARTVGGPHRDHRRRARKHPMSKYDFDLFTIGAGSGGVAASRRAGSYGARVAICEERRVGGTCVLRGCVPKKLLVYASHYAEEIEDAEGYGWTLGEATLDWGRLIAAKNAELDRLEGVYHKLLAAGGVEVIEGRGVVVDPHTVEVEGRRFTTERILIATGGWPTLPEVPGIEHAMTSNEALDLLEVPRRLAIVGGGYIGVEFAGIFNNAGSQVIQIVRGDNVLRHFDEDVRQALATEMRKCGVDLRTEEHVNAIVREGDVLNLRLDKGEHLEVDAILYATGRHPHSHGIGLEECGVAVDPKGHVLVDEWSRTSVQSIWAIGDVTARPALTPVAIADGRAFAETEFHDNPVPVDHGFTPTAVFSQPSVGTVGMSEDVARDCCDGPIDVYRAQFRAMKHVLPDRDAKVLMKLVVERETDLVLGVHMVGPDAAEIIQGFAVALRCGATKKQFDATIGIHPTSAEELVTMATPVSPVSPVS